MVSRMTKQQWANLHPNVKRGVYAAQENMKVVDGKAFNAEGRDITHMVEVVPKTTDKQIRGLQAIDDLSAHEIDNGGFVFAFFKQSRTIVERFPTLTQQDTARLMFIGTYVAWENGRLQYENGRYINKKALEKMVDMSTKHFNLFFKRLEAEDIIREDVETGDITINPSVFYRGSIKEIGFDVSHLTYSRLFRDTVRKLYSQFKGRTLGQLALIYSVMPFLSFNTNIVCYNPEEKDGERIRPMDLDKLSVLLGYENPQKLKRALNSVKVEDKPVFGFFENVNDRRKLRVTVNPRVIYNGNGKGLDVLLAQFN
ncbi:hypothetical protein [Psychrobacillus sp. FSL K6-1415]|uniref:hypothetical protein n=1 Tax=Psychrobacillus sp. FSL K6-1415 TaxID=2921544 RepID=UPI0030F55ADF